MNTNKNESSYTQDDEIWRLRIEREEEPNRKGLGNRSTPVRGDEKIIE